MNWPAGEPPGRRSKPTMFSLGRRPTMATAELLPGVALLKLIRRFELVTANVSPCTMPLGGFGVGAGVGLSPPPPLHPSSGSVSNAYRANGVRAVRARAPRFMGRLLLRLQMQAAFGARHATDAP